ALAALQFDLRHDCDGVERWFLQTKNPESLVRSGWGLHLGNRPILAAWGLNYDSGVLRDVQPPLRHWLAAGLELPFRFGGYQPVGDTNRNHPFGCPLRGAGCHYDGAFP